ncbi:MAG: hypothetical protein ABSC56_11760 [Solirubrobacteraceae bacterium]|jgi:hypothetical protein
MALLPKERSDLALAPVAANIDGNLARLRDKSVEEIGYEVGLQLNHVARSNDAAERAGCVLAVALRLVNMHGWHADITEDHARLRLTGGSVPIELALSPTIRAYING